jgi:hypothetical protein
MELSGGQRVNEIAYRRSLFEQKFLRYKEAECWPWIAAKNQHGNGIFGMGLLWPGTKAAHVVSWFFYRDETLDLADAPTFYHLCGEPSCVNPRHLAMFGTGGLQNDEEVLKFLVDRHPGAALPLAQAACLLEENRERRISKAASRLGESYQ